MTILLTTTAAARQTATLSRSGGVETPLRVFAPSGQSCAPLAVISPGAGGTERGYAYLAEGLRERGYLAVVMGPKESGPSTLRHDIGAVGIPGGLQEMVTDPALERDRMPRPHGSSQPGRDAVPSSLQSSARPLHGIRHRQVQGRSAQPAQCPRHEPVQRLRRPLSFRPGIDFLG